MNQPFLTVLLKEQSDILKDDEELSRVFPNGAKDFQISQRRDAKNIKEILAKSPFTNEEKDLESKPCKKDCAYCHLLRETEGKGWGQIDEHCWSNITSQLIIQYCRGWPNSPTCGVQQCVILCVEQC